MASFLCNCGRNFKSINNYWNHIKKCKEDQPVQLEDQHGSHAESSSGSTSSCKFNNNSRKSEPYTTPHPIQKITRGSDPVPTSIPSTDAAKGISASAATSLKYNRPLAFSINFHDDKKDEDGCARHETEGQVDENLGGGRNEVAELGLKTPAGASVIEEKPEDEPKNTDIQVEQISDVKTANGTLQENPKKRRHEQKKYPCKLCARRGIGMAYNTPQGLSMHKSSKHQEKRICPWVQCGGQFSSNSTLNRHVNTVHKLSVSITTKRRVVEREGRVKCGNCGNDYANRRYLNRHLRGTRCGKSGDEASTSDDEQRG